MKLLLVLVIAIAVYAADDRYFSHESEVNGSVNKYQLSPEEFEAQGKAQHLPNGPEDNSVDEIHNSIEEDLILKENSLLVADEHEVMKEQAKGKLRRSRCKARNACVVMGGFCVTNSTLCSGRLVPEGCKGINCQCCVPGTIEAKFDHLEEELQSLKENMISKLELLKVDTNNMNLTINTKLDSLAVNQECPVGFYRHIALNGSPQCFKFFTNSQVSWTAAKSKCQSEGLVLAKPGDPVGLRRYLVNTYGDKRSWVGARGTGSTINWDRDGTTLSSSNPAWYPGYPGGRLSSSYCLVSASDTSTMNQHPNNPYYMNSCTSSYYPLCELLLG